MRGLVAKHVPFHWAWIIVATCFLNIFVNYSILLGYGVVFPEMIEALGIGRTAGVTILNTYLIVYTTLSPITGYLADRLGARWVITSSLFIISVGVFLLGSARTLTMACVFFAVVGFGATGVWAPTNAVIQRWFSTHRRGLALGIVTAGYGLGFATMGATLPWIMLRFHWRYAWYFLAIGALILVPANGLLLRNDPESLGSLPWDQKDANPLKSLDLRKQPRRNSLFFVFRNQTFWLVSISYFAISYSLYGMTTFMVDFAKNQLGMPIERAGLLATVHGICQVVGVLTILPLSDYIGRKKTILMSNFFIILCLSGILLTTNSWIWLYILVGIMAVFYGATFPTYAACAGDYFPRQLIGSVVGAWSLFYGLGVILAHWVGGLLRDTTGNYHCSFQINAAMAVLGLLVIAAVKTVESARLSKSDFYR